MRLAAVALAAPHATGHVFGQPATYLNMYRATGGWPQPSQQHFSHYGADHVAGYSAYGGGSQPAGIAGFRASQPLPLDPWIEAGGRRDRGRSTGGRAGRHRSHAAKSGRRASASAEAAQLSSLPADVAGDYLQDYPGVNNVLQRFKCVSGSWQGAACHSLSSMPPFVPHPRCSTCQGLSFDSTLLSDHLMRFLPSLPSHCIQLPA